MTQEELIHKLGRKWRINVESLNHIIRGFRKKYTNEIPISCTSRYLRRVTGCNSRRISGIIDLALDCKLLTLINDKYSFNHGDTEDNYCRTYCFNDEIVCLLNEITNNANMGEKRGEEGEKLFNLLYSNNESDNETSNEIILGDSLEISSKKEYTMNETQKEELLEQLKKKYKQIGQANLMLNEINKSYTVLPGILYTVFEPKIHELQRKSGKKCRFGIRANSMFCSLTKDVNSRVLNRWEVLDELFGKDLWEEYDLNASIYRIARSIRDRKWYSDKGDIYEILNSGTFSSKEERDNFKIICNIVNFAKDMNAACNAYRSKFEWARHMKNIEIIPILEPIKQRITDFCGKFDSEIFLHESCIVICAAYKMVCSNHKVAPLYDCIFVEKGLSSEIEKYIEQSFNEYYDAYLLDIKREKFLYNEVVWAMCPNISDYKEFRSVYGTIDKFMEEFGH